MRFTRAPALAAAIAATSCGCGFGGAPVSSVYVVPDDLASLSGDSFYDHPWPSNMRLENGSPRLAGFPNPRHIPIIDSYITSVTGQLDGFSPAGAGFVRFEGPIDPETLPKTPTASLHRTASVQLIDIDPQSPEHGERKLISLLWRAPKGIYFQANTLAFMPTVGFPLRPHTRYAFVVTDAVRSADGGPVTASQDLAAILAIEPSADERIHRAQSDLAPALGQLAKAGIDRDGIVQLAVFDTADPTAELLAFRDALRTTVPAPTAYPGAWKRRKSTESYDEYVGRYGPSPNFQAGKIPFADYGDGGSFNYVDGKPTVVDLFDLRFSLAVPKAAACPMPPDGYPIVLYAHGTGGDWRSYVFDGTADALTRQCLAAMGVDQIFHGTRPGSPLVTGTGNVDVLFFNFNNVEAARTNARESALDEVQRARLFTESHASVPANIAVTGSEIRFDGSKLLFFGHSQGGLNGPLYLASDDSSRGGVLSGSGALISITLLEKTEPSPSVAGVVQTIFLGLGGEELDEMSMFHPGISLAQTIVDVADPIHYARLLATEPREGFAAKSIYMTEGVNPDGTGDHFAPPHGIEAHGIAVGLPLQLPAQRPPVELAWGGARPTLIPPDGLAGDLARGAASGILAQWAVPEGDDGHFVVFDVPEARAQAAEFVRNLAEDRVGRVPPP